MKIIEAPQPQPEKADLFLAGGMSNCPNWQEMAIEQLSEVQGIAFNPRRSDVFTDDIAREQIVWEHVALRRSDAVIFWFPKDTLCPITLFELGVFTQRKDTPIFVGTDPIYGRRFAVVAQLALERPEVKVYDTVEDTINAYIEYSRN